MTRPSRLARYGFADNGTRAADLLGPAGLRLWDLDAQEPTGTDAAELIHSLSRGADPNLALRQLHRLVESAGRSTASASAGRGETPPVSRMGSDNAAAAAILRALFDDPGFRRRLAAVLGASSALGDHLVANPDDWRVLATGKTGLPPNAEGHLTIPSDLAGGDSAGDGPLTVAALRRAYRLSLLRIAAADLTGGRGLEPTMAALSRLADETLAAAYAIAVSEL
ncbi:MAG: [glutamine synthetase] adenylyltransferase / [glutamine synthetase]-adenylyl-L-tyrosine, partial [Actinoplanes sp.]|nr:[glutamine synthetase] adenylyltransferase / [glutamine synthetase]-adenylyl-L-tyrosine [Actinoplanes sp.]